MSPVAALKFDFQPKYDEEYITIEERILINLEIIVINNLLVGVRTAKAKINDYDAELKFIADWLEKPKNAENVDYVCDEECIKFADDEEILLQNSTAQNIVDCNRSRRTIISEKFAKAQGRFRTKKAQPNCIIHIQMKYTSMCEDFKLSSWKRRKRKNINKYYLTTIKVKMKWRTVES